MAELIPDKTPGVLDTADVLRFRVGLKMAAVGQTAYLRREARGHGLTVEGLLEAAMAAAPHDEVLHELIGHRHRASGSAPD